MIKTLLFIATAAWLTGAAAAETDPERAAIEAVLTNYRTAVSTSDEALFTSTILDDEICFTGVNDKKSVSSSAELKNVAGFRRSVFHSGEKLEQTFDHVEIKRDGGLAEVTLHFVTKVRDTQEGGEGFKTMTLLKTAGQWKIAAEFYTFKPLNAG